MGFLNVVGRAAGVLAGGVGDAVKGAGSVAGYAVDQVAPAYGAALQGQRQGEQDKRDRRRQLLSDRISVARAFAPGDGYELDFGSTAEGGADAVAALLARYPAMGALLGMSTAAGGGGAPAEVAAASALPPISTSGRRPGESAAEERGRVKTEQEREHAAQRRERDVERARADLASGSGAGGGRGGASPSVSGAPSAIPEGMQVTPALRAAVEANEAAGTRTSRRPFATFTDAEGEPVRVFHDPNQTKEARDARRRAETTTAQPRFIEVQGRKFPDTPEGAVAAREWNRDLTTDRESISAAHRPPRRSGGGDDGDAPTARQARSDARSVAEAEIYNFLSAPGTNRLGIGRLREIVQRSGGALTEAEAIAFARRTGAQINADARTTRKAEESAGKRRRFGAPAGDGARSGGGGGRAAGAAAPARSTGSTARPAAGASQKETITREEAAALRSAGVSQATINSRYTVR
jgi:hypothetical protein